jgi:hypothetical protein
MQKNMLPVWVQSGTDYLKLSIVRKSRLCDHIRERALDLGRIWFSIPVISLADPTVVTESFNVPGLHFFPPVK